jgi:hypothetical protein
VTKPEIARPFIHQISLGCGPWNESKKSAEKADLMATLGPKHRLYRSSCNGIELRLRAFPGGSWLTIKKPGQDRQYFDIEESQVEAVVAEFESIGDSVERFQEFVNARA